MKKYSSSFLFSKIFMNLPPESRAFLDHLLRNESQRNGVSSRRKEMKGDPDAGTVLRWRPQRSQSLSPAKLLEKITRAAGTFEHERRFTSELVQELLSLPSAERTEAVTSETRFHSLSLCEEILEASRRVSFRDPKAGRELADLGLLVARSLDPKVYGEHLVRDLCGRAWSELGNACRVSSDLDGAERALQKAGACLVDSYDPLEKARFFNIKAVLRKDQRQFKEALDLRERAIATYRRFDDNHNLGLSLCSKGSDLLEMGEPELAAKALLEAVELIGPDSEPRTFLAAHHNLATALVFQERYLEAAEAFSKIQKLYREDLWSQARQQWLRGRIATGLGRLEDAKQAFSKARETFRTHEIPYDFALVSIELALVNARLGQLSEVKRLAAEMMPIFKSRRIHREALAALALFRQAVDQETVNVRTLRQIIWQLERAPKEA